MRFYPRAVSCQSWAHGIFDMPWQQTAILAFATVNCVVLVEILFGLMMRRRVHSVSGTLTNISAYTVYLIIAAIYGYAEYLIMSYMQLSLHTARLTPSLGYWMLLIVADDFCFYWFHRLSHKLGILWMSHVVHHSSHEFNLSVGLRQTWLPFLGVLFWLPLTLVGFRPEHILLVQAASLTYQFLMHSQLYNLPRVWGWLFNTPSHHRVHHGRNAEYIDRNFAGVFIIWDRLFGSFVPETITVDYGINTPARRGEIIYAQIQGPFEFLRNLFWRSSAENLAVDPYVMQRTSVWFALLLAALALAALGLVLANPRWFM
jgi:sterol desaturase/sphingolipid hydroxylase (fatty acid hydroxylase superfamily)